MKSRRLMPSPTRTGHLENENVARGGVASESPWVMSVGQRRTFGWAASEMLQKWTSCCTPKR